MIPIRRKSVLPKLSKATSNRAAWQMPHYAWMLALQAKMAKHAPAYGELLRRLTTLEDSEEWKNGWKYFYSG
jgi:hypothetical protein